MTPHSRAPYQTDAPTCPPWTERLPHTLLHTLDCVSLHPTWVHAPSFTAPHRLFHPTVSLAHSPQPHQSPGPARVSLVHGIARLAAALVTVGPVVAVLGLIAVMVPIGTLILRGAGQEGPGGPRLPTRQP